ncbi:MAG: ATP-binding protein [Opitutaceae bacterium]
MRPSAGRRRKNGCVGGRAFSEWRPESLALHLAGTEFAGWFYQQDYITFLAVLGWLTVGLVAWGNAAAAADSRRIPWRWFAFFAFFVSLDGTLDLAKMITPRIWPPEIDPLFRLCGYGCLLEFSRRGVRFLRWARIGPLVPAAIPVAALAVVFYFPNASPVPESIVAVLASVSAAVVISASVGKGSRSLLATAAALLLLGGGEMLRGQGSVAIDGLYGLFVTGEGIETAVFSAVLAWVAGGGLWLHGVERRRARAVLHGGAKSPLGSLILPAIIAVTLVVGFFLVNWSSAHARATIERNYNLQARTAALAIDAESLIEALAGYEVDAASVQGAVEKVRRQVEALRDVGPELSRVYVWKVAGGVIVLPQEWIAAAPGVAMSPDTPAVKLVSPNALPADTRAHLLGPLGSREESVMLLSSPIMDALAGGHAGWLGIEVSAREWLTAQASARLQTIALVGLFASLVVAFLAHQMLREYEGELLVAKESAEAADRAKDEFLAVMSHEMRTPMQSVLGYGELLARTPLDELQEGYLDAIRSQGRTLLRIVQDILDFAILRKSSYTLKSEEIHLHRLVRSAFETVRPLAARKELGFDLFIATAVPEVVRGDGVRIEQILLNLLGNAVKFTDHGRIQLDVSLSVEPGIGKTDTKTVVFSVSDTGMGIRKADQRKLFEPFTRLSYAENTRREGAGLGLAIVRRLCELMGGDIQLVSEWGRGTRFFVRLPLPVLEATAAGESEDSEAGEAVPAGEIADLAKVLPLRMVVADDNPFIRRLMVEYLRSIGYEPVALGDGTEAVARWREADILMMDLRMPGLDGVAAASRIRAESGHAMEPWIIGVSATLSESEIARAMEAGMNDFLGKPFFVQSLIEAIKASPLYAQRSGEPRPWEETSSAGPSAPAKEQADAELAAPVEEAEEIPPPLEARVMNWMPDLSADGGGLVEEAVAEIPQILDEIDRALDESDMETAADRAHYLKNTIFALRMDPMVAPCRAVYEKANEGDEKGSREQLANLREAFATWAADRAAQKG